MDVVSYILAARDKADVDGHLIDTIQYTPSTADGGNNVLKINFTDGTAQEFNIKNGSKGSTGITPSIKVASGSNINAVGTPSVTASTSGTTTTITFNHLKGATGAKGDSGIKSAMVTAKTGTGSHVPIARNNGESVCIAFVTGSILNVSKRYFTSDAVIGTPSTSYESDSNTHYKTSFWCIQSSTSQRSIGYILM